MKCPITDVRIAHNHFNRVLIVGLGQLGLAVAKHAVETGFENVYGYDVSPKAMDRAEKATRINKATDFGDFDVYILCVSTHKPEDTSSPQIEGLLSIVHRISKEAKRDGALVPKGTSKIVYGILNHRLHVIHAPHRWHTLEEKEHGVNQPRVIGGVCDCCLKAGMQFYNGGSSLCSFSDNANNNSFSSCFRNLSCSCQSLGIPIHPVSEIEIAEITKVVENSQRYLQIAFAEDLYLYCQVNNINFSELRDALNTKWNVTILEPREGIGGHCIPKDTKIFLQSSSKCVKSRILTAAMEVDQDYQRHRQSIGLK
jgi:UDP-N-acetyl-D-mannosaminuronic acid dehydrogenase